MKQLIQKSSRWVAILLAAVVVILTSMVVANATQTITTPNAASISYNLNTGASSAAITPVTNKPVLVMGCCTSFGGFEGVGQVNLLHNPNSNGGAFIRWVGLESTSPAAITEGGSGVAGTHIVFIDFEHQVDIQVASGDTILIHNASDAARAGNVTLIW